jgi:hypothetical protein
VFKGMKERKEKEVLAGADIRRSDDGRYSVEWAANSRVTFRIIDDPSEEADSILEVEKITRR